MTAHCPLLSIQGPACGREGSERPFVGGAEGGDDRLPTFLRGQVVIELAVKARR